MKKLNNKGLSLIEIIVSVALISLVLVLTFNLLIDVSHEKSISTNATKYDINKALFIKNFEDNTISLNISSIAKKNQDGATCNSDVCLYCDEASDPCYVIDVIDSSKIRFDEKIYEFPSEYTFDTNRISITSFFNPKYDVYNIDMPTNNGNNISLTHYQEK